MLLLPENICSSVDWEQLCQCHLGTIVLRLLGNICGSVTWEQSHQSHLGTIAPVSFWDNRASLTWEQSQQSHLGTFVPVPFAVNKKKCMKNWYFEFFSVELLENCKSFSNPITVTFTTESLLKFHNLRKFYNKKRSKLYTVLWYLYAFLERILYINTFLLKWRPQLCVSSLIFSTITWRTISIDKFILRNYAAYYQRGCCTGKSLTPIFCSYL